MDSFFKHFFSLIEKSEEEVYVPDVSLALPEDSLPSNILPEAIDSNDMENFGSSISSSSDDQTLRNFINFRSDSNLQNIRGDITNPFSNVIFQVRKNENYTNTLKIEDEFRVLPQLTDIHKIISKKLYNSTDCYCIKLLIDLWENYLNLRNSLKCEVIDKKQTSLYKSKYSLKLLYKVAMKVYDSITQEMLDQLNSQIEAIKGREIFMIQMIGSKKILSFQTIKEYKDYYRNKLNTLSSKIEGLAKENFLK